MTSNKDNKYFAKDLFIGSDPATAVLKKEFIPTFSTNAINPNNKSKITNNKTIRFCDYINLVNPINLVEYNLITALNVANLISGKIHSASFTLKQDGVTFLARYIYEVIEYTKQFMLQKIREGYEFMGIDKYQYNKEITAFTEQFESKMSSPVKYLTETVINGVRTIITRDQFDGKILYKNISRVECTFADPTIGEKDKLNKEKEVLNIKTTTSNYQTVKTGFKLVNVELEKKIMEFKKTGSDVDTNPSYIKAKQELDEFNKMVFTTSNINSIIPRGTTINKIMLTFGSMTCSKGASLSVKLIPLWVGFTPGSANSINTSNFCDDIIIDEPQTNDNSMDISDCL